MIKFIVPGTNTSLWFTKSAPFWSLLFRGPGRLLDGSVQSVFPFVAINVHNRSLKLGTSIFTGRSLQLKGTNYEISNPADFLLHKQLFDKIVTINALPLRRVSFWSKFCILQNDWKSRKQRPRRVSVLLIGAGGTKCSRSRPNGCSSSRSSSLRSRSRRRLLKFVSIEQNTVQPLWKTSTAAHVLIIWSFQGVSGVSKRRRCTTSEGKAYNVTVSLFKFSFPRFNVTIPCRKKTYKAQIWAYLRCGCSGNRWLGSLEQTI